ncbi:MAG: hypothetical protein M5R40_20520 [Anaerolineae bacterium]|nr:hypothetical protein [Anaerolineae bacterium]
MAHRHRDRGREGLQDHAQALPARRPLHFEQAQAYVAQYVAALNGVIAGAIRKVTLSQSVARAGLKSDPLERRRRQKLAVRYDTLPEDFIDGQWRPARKSRSWRHAIPTFRRALTLVWLDDRRVADQDRDEVRAFLRMLDAPPAPHPAAACDDRGIRLNLALRTDFRFTRTRKVKESLNVDLARGGRGAGRARAARVVQGVPAD